MELYKHQREIIEDDPKKYGLFLGTGSGKTKTACHLAYGETLVVCPKTILEAGVWQKEKQFITVISKETFKRDWKKLPSYSTLILDEAHTVAGIQPATFQRNHVLYPKMSQIHAAVLDYISKNNPERIYALTATPIPNPMVVFGLATILGYRWDFKKYRDDFYFELRRNVWLVKKDKKNKEKLASIINRIGAVGRLQDYFDVPEQTYKTHHVEMTKDQTSKLGDLQLLYPNPLVQLGKRHQLEQGWYEGSYVKENKTAAVDTYMQEFGKVVVFCRYINQIERYKNIFAKKYKIFVLDGRTKQRGEVIYNANKARSCMLIVQSSISTGYSIPDFPCMIFASESYSYIDREQAEGRILRANHLKKNLYVTLVAGWVDSRVRDNINNKQDFVEKMHAEAGTKNNK